jgi:hypothetical protein
MTYQPYTPHSDAAINRQKRLNIRNKLNIGEPIMLGYIDDTDYERELSKAVLPRLHKCCPASEDGETHRSITRNLLIYMEKHEFAKEDLTATLEWLESEGVLKMRPNYWDSNDPIAGHLLKW